MHIKNTLKLARSNPSFVRAIQPRCFLHSSVESVNDVARKLPPLPPPSFGTTRERLAQWQIDYDKHIGQTILDEKGAILEKLFPLNSQSARSSGGTDGEIDDGESALLGYNSRSYDSLGSMGDWIEQTFLGPGFLVEVTPNLSKTAPELAVFVALHSYRPALLSLKGKLMLVRDVHIRWALPDWMSPEELEPLQRYLLEHGVSLEKNTGSEFFGKAPPAEIINPIRQKIQTFNERSLSIYQKHANILDCAHDLLSSATDPKLMTLSEIAYELIGHSGIKLDGEAIWAVRTALKRLPVEFVPYGKSIERQSQVFYVRSKSSVQNIHIVRKWLREYREAVAYEDEPTSSLKTELEATEGYRKVSHFVQHARELILEGRRSKGIDDQGTQTTTDVSIEMSRTPRANGKFQKHESLLIQFMETWALQEGFQRESSLLTLPPFLLSQVGLYHDRDPSQLTGLHFLAELGVLPPWTNKALFDPTLMLDVTNRGVSENSASPLLQKSAAVIEEDVNGQMNDVMRPYRRDWGSLRVFCIDPADAEEIDDGISLEQDTNDPEKSWIRVHVANPSAYLQQDSDVVTHTASVLQATFYSPEISWPMLPIHLSRKFSLGPGNTCLTFSMLVDSQGEIHATDIQPGIVHNVVRVSYDYADELIGHKAYQGTQWIVGANPTQSQRPSKSLASLTPEDVQALQKLNALAKTLFQRRLAKRSFSTRKAAMGINVWSPSGSTEGSKRSRLPFYSPDRDVSSNFNGQPAIQITTEPFFDPSQNLLESFGTHDLVAEMMLLAGAAASAWAKERGLPFPYRAQMTATDLDELNKDYDKLTFLKTPRGPQTVTEYLALQEHRLHYRRSFMSPQPVYPGAVGFPQYARVTSPLRRFSDLLCHWQLQAAIAYEHETGSKVNGDMMKELGQFAQDRGLSFYSDKTLQRILPRIEARAIQLTYSSYLSESFWKSQLLYRAFYHGEFALPSTFRVLVLQGDTSGEQVLVVGRLLDFNLHVTLDRSNQAAENEGGIRYCDEWEAEVQEVNLEKNVMVLRPLRLISRIDDEAAAHYVEHFNRFSTLRPRLPESRS